MALSTKPLQLWDSTVNQGSGHVKRVTDSDIQSSVIEIAGTNLSANYISCPANPKQTLGIKLPFFAMTVKNVFFYANVFVLVSCPRRVADAQVLLLRNPDPGRQRRAQKVSRFELPGDSLIATLYD